MNLLWLQSGGCGGCTMSLLCADSSDLFGSLTDAGIRILWHPSLSEESGAEVLDILSACAAGHTPVDLLCIEGSLLRGPDGSGRFHMLGGSGRPMIAWVRELAAHARYTLAIGSCAAWGGITTAGPNPAGACGLQYDGEEPGGLLGADYRSAAGLPVINVAGCPTHPGWVMETLLALALGQFDAGSMDALARPRSYADQLVHHGCARNEYYEFKASAERPSDLGCLMENMGCKGTQAHADCNLRPWNGGGSCTRGGYACISCTEPGFEEPGHPFVQTPKVAGIPIGLPSDMPKAWFVALAALSKSATPKRVRENAAADHLVVTPAIRRTGLK
ncbi:NADH-quinone oxidoreductase subunit B family protein [Pseudothauera rhizosphaerae]|uniref:hydrogenase (acceptor) n=1 Tax=Pseudothauera rhizosphaerae TaxID=2565932 RepID=A0A4S4AYV7_9RHOO|nr:HupU protein [Pseudothauera rhizosphaerae]THF65346.1 HupU protein [Pseudothauera rhizosphaerae]